MFGKLAIQSNPYLKRFSSVFIILFPLGLFRFFDSILSYIFPIVLETHVNSNLIIGILMAVSSVVGLICDFLLPQIFPNKSWRFFLLAGIFLAFLFPFTILLGDVFSLMSMFVLGVIIWGVYYEFILFSEQNFVVSEFKKEEYSKTWGIIGIMLDVIGIIAPIVASLLLAFSSLTYTFIIVAILIIAFLFTMLVVKKSDLKEDVKTKSNIKYYLSFLKEFKYWRSLSARIIPLLIMAFILELVSVTFWVFGGLFGKEYIGIPGLDWIILVVSTVPMLLGSLIISKLKIKRRKKLLSQISILLGGITLIPFVFSETSVILTLSLIFLSSLFLSFSWPLNDAVYSDLQERLKTKGIHLVGLSNATYSIAFIIAPLLIGYILDQVGFHMTFSLLGLVLAITSVMLIIFTPKKLKLPQKTIQNIK